MNQLTELTAKRNIYIIFIQKHEYYLSEQEQKCHDPLNEWDIFVDISIEIIRQYSQYVGICLRSLNNIEKILTRIICVP